MRKLLTIHARHHSKADVDHLLVPRKQGERGLMQLEEAYVVEITKIVEYYRQEGRTTNTNCLDAPT